MSHNLAPASSLVGVNIPIYTKDFWVSKISHQYTAILWFLLRKSITHFTHPPDVNLETRDRAKGICGSSDHYPFTLFSGVVNHRKESVPLCTGKSKFLIAVELKFYDDKYLWTEISTRLGYLLVSLCLLSFLNS